MGLTSQIPEDVEPSQIAGFYNDRTILITGASGFVGKVLLEKLLRSCPNVKKIYILLRPKDGLCARERLNILFRCELFDRVRKEQPKCFSKVLPLRGQVEFPDLGLSPEDRTILCKEVSVVFHIAALVHFKESLRNSVKTNLLGTKHVIDLCHKLTALKAYIHVSTAYSNYDRTEIEEVVYEPPISPYYLMETVQLMDDDVLSEITPAILGAHPNPYTLTKNLSETLLEEESGKLPVVLIRPSVITASWKEPFPGWIDNYTACTGICAAVATGMLRSVPQSHKIHCDIIPVDVLANLMIVTAWNTATVKPNKLAVYNCTLRQEHDLTFKKVVDFAVMYSTKYPSAKLLRRPSCSCDSVFVHLIKSAVQHSMVAHIIDFVSSLTGNKMRMVHKFELLHKFMNAIHPFAIKDYIFRQENATDLTRSMTMHDQIMFNLDATQLNLSDYFKDYILGIRQHLLKEDAHSIPVARESLKRLTLVTYLVKISATVFGGYGLLWHTHAAQWMWKLVTACVSL